MAAGQCVRPRPGRRAPPASTAGAIGTADTEIRGDSHEALIAELVDLAGEIGYAVTFEDTGAADGVCNAKEKRIAVADRLEANGRLAALIHELAHALVAEDRDAPRLDYAQGELIAESVASTAARQSAWTRAPTASPT